MVVLKYEDMRKYILGLVFIIMDICAAATRPNIIYILCDDVGWNDFSFHGSDQILTPNIDALAYSGLILHKHYVQAVCSPSRAALLSGKYPSNTGMQHPLGGSEAKALPEGKILPQYLKDLGYKTSIIGKWHVGYYKEKFTPLKRGFDCFFGYYNGATSYYSHIYNYPNRKRREICKEGRTDYAAEITDSGLNGLDFHRNKTAAWDLSGKYATDLFTEEAVKQIENHDTSSPLFLYLAHLAGHAGNWGQNLEAPLEVIQKFNYIIDPNRRTYAAMIWKLDESVGKVVAALKKRGILENSIIIFVSDNGAPTISDFYQTPGSNYPLRGLKGTQWEGGVRTPALMWSPLLKHNAHVSHHMMHITDWLPTLIRAAGGNLAVLTNASLDGVNQWDALVHNNPSAREEMLLMLDDTTNITAIRKGDWKLVEGSSSLGDFDGYSGDSGLHKSNPKYNISSIYESDTAKAINSTKALPDKKTIIRIRDEVTVKCPHQENVTVCDTFRNQKPCLFNIAKDPCETNDVSQLYPELRDELLALLNKYEHTLVPGARGFFDNVNANPERFNNTWQPWII